MAEKRREPPTLGTQQPRDFSDEVRGGLSWKAWAAPGLFAFLLSLPCLGLAYLWDDYAFLNNLLKLRLTDYLPDPTGTFYRPISRGLYFSILSSARESGALLGHWINIVALALTASLVAGAGARLRDQRTGILAGFLFAGLACVPTLVAWLSCAQDLLAILFIVLALHCRLSGRNVAALALTAAALLSKETALAAVPALALVDWAVRPRDARTLRSLAAFSLLIVVWAVVHPAIKRLLARGLKVGETGYVGLQEPIDVLKQAGGYIIELANLRVGPYVPTWTVAESVLLWTTALAGAVWLWRTLRSPTRTDRPRRATIVVGSLLALGPWTLTSLMLDGWSPYYAAFPAVGTSLLLATWVAGRPKVIVIPLIALYFGLGLWSRATDMDELFLTENNLRISSKAHERFRTNLMAVQPSVPEGSQLLFSVQASGRLRVYHQVYGYQMPRFWYRDPTLVIRKPEDRLPGNRPEFLFTVPPDLDVVRIDPPSLTVVSSSGRQPHYLVVEQALRTYAMGLAGIGETDAAARLLVEMPEVDVNFEVLHHRMAMMFLLADGREEDARQLAEGIPPTPPSWAIDNLPAVLAQQPRLRQFDAAGMRAFGVDTTDVAALRELTLWFVVRGYYDVAGRFGGRILSLTPRNPLALRAIALRDSVEAVRALTGDEEFRAP